MNKEGRLAARLKSITAVSNLVGTRIWPMIVPGGADLPAICYQVLSDTPSNGSRGATGLRRMEVRVSVLGEATATQAGYDAVLALADAVIGDEGSSPTGMSGWRDSDGDEWKLTDEADEAGELEGGQDVFRVYMRHLDFAVWHSGS